MGHCYVHFAFLFTLKMSMVYRYTDTDTVTDTATDTVTDTVTDTDTVGTSCAWPLGWPWARFRLKPVKNKGIL